MAQSPSFKPLRTKWIQNIIISHCVGGSVWGKIKQTTDQNYGPNKQDLRESLKANPLSDTSAVMLEFFSLFLRSGKKERKKEKPSYWIPSLCSLLFAYKCITKSKSKEINFLLPSFHNGRIERRLRKTDHYNWNSSSTDTHVIPCGTETGNWEHELLQPMYTSACCRI